MHLRKRIFVNILLILSYFFYTNYTMAKASESESIYLIKKKIITLAETSLPKSRLLIDKKLKKTKQRQELEIKKTKQRQELEIEKTKQRQELEIEKTKIENTAFKVIIKYLPNKEKPDNNELVILKEAITKFSNLNNLTIQGYAEKRFGDSSSKVRRLSLKRALFLRELFLKNNFESTKIFVRAMGYDANISGNKDIVIISTQ